MNPQIAVFFIFNLCLVAQGAKRKILQLQFTKMSIDNKNTELFEYNYIINRTSNNISAIYADFKLSEDVLKLTGTFSLGLKYTDKYINYITLDLDYCKALQLLYKDLLMKAIADGVRAISNYPLDCPLLKNKLYYFNGFTFNTKVFPSYFPEISFALHCKFNANLRPLSEVKIYGDLKKN